MGPTPTPTRTLGMRLSCNFVKRYTIAYRVQYMFTRVHAPIPNGHPREEKRACRSIKSADKSASIVVRVRRTRRLPREDPRAEVGEDVRVDVSPMEFKLYAG